MTLTTSPVFGFVSLAICFMGMALQGFTITARYLNHPIKILTSYNKPEFVELPSASICIDYIPDEVKVRTMYPDIYQAKILENATYWRLWQKYLTLEQYMRTTITASEAVTKCRLYAPNMTKVTCTDWTYQANGRLSWYWKCFTLFGRQQQRAHIPIKDNEFRYYRTEDVKDLRWFHFHINTKDYKSTMAATSLGLSIHRNDVPMILDEGSTTFRQFDFSQYNQASFSYTRQIIRRLEAPYPTSCIDYQENGEDFRRDKLVNRCARKKYYENTGYFPCDILASNMTAFGKTKFGSHIKGHQDSTQERYECNRLFPYPDCHVLNYLIRNKGVAKRLKGDYNRTFHVTVYGPSEDTMIIMEKAAFLGLRLVQLLEQLVEPMAGCFYCRYRWHYSEKH
ncbi:hypothetical protein HDE_12181 [Halotydeus destructor]|nr:hypothetical protein HDE_12181 [Halotydeus destructor]